MAFMKSIDLKGFLFFMLLTVTSQATNFDCNGKAFYCVNSTHFMICVDLGRGTSTTIDDVVIPCPSPTVCEKTNRFECEFPTPSSTVVTTEATKLEVTTLAPLSTTPIPFQEYFNTVSTTTVSQSELPLTDTPLSVKPITTKLDASKLSTTENATTDKAILSDVNATSEAVTDSNVNIATLSDTNISNTQNSSLNLTTLPTELPYNYNETNIAQTHGTEPSMPFDAEYIDVGNSASNDFNRTISEQKISTENVLTTNIDSTLKSSTETMSYATEVPVTVFSTTVTTVTNLKDFIKSVQDITPTSATDNSTLLDTTVTLQPSQDAQIIQESQSVGGMSKNTTSNDVNIILVNSSSINVTIAGSDQLVNTTNKSATVSFSTLPDIISTPLESIQDVKKVNTPQSKDTTNRVTGDVSIAQETTTSIGSTFVNQLDTQVNTNQSTPELTTPVSTESAVIKHTEPVLASESTFITTESSLNAISNDTTSVTGPFVENKQLSKTTENPSSSTVFGTNGSVGTTDNIAVIVNELKTFGTDLTVGNNSVYVTKQVGVSQSLKNTTNEVTEKFSDVNVAQDTTTNIVLTSTDQLDIRVTELPISYTDQSTHKTETILIGTKSTIKDYTELLLTSDTTPFITTEASLNTISYNTTIATKEIVTDMQSPKTAVDPLNSNAVFLGSNENTSATPNVVVTINDFSTPRMDLNVGNNSEYVTRQSSENTTNQVTEKFSNVNIMQETTTDTVLTSTDQLDTHVTELLILNTNQSTPKTETTPISTKSTVKDNTESVLTSETASFITTEASLNVLSYNTTIVTEKILTNTQSPKTSEDPSNSTAGFFGTNESRDATTVIVTINEISTHRTDLHVRNNSKYVANQSSENTTNQVTEKFSDVNITQETTTNIVLISTDQLKTRVTEPLMLNTNQSTPKIETTLISTNSAVQDNTESVLTSVTTFIPTEASLYKSTIVIKDIVTDTQSPNTSEVPSNANAGLFETNERTGATTNVVTINDSSTPRMDFTVGNNSEYATKQVQFSDVNVTQETTTNTVLTTDQLDLSVTDLPILNTDQITPKQETTFVSTRSTSTENTNLVVTTDTTFINTESLPNEISYSSANNVRQETKTNEPLLKASSIGSNSEYTNPPNKQEINQTVLPAHIQSYSSLSPQVFNPDSGNYIEQSTFTTFTIEPSESTIAPLPNKESTKINITVDINQHSEAYTYNNSKNEATTETIISSTKPLLPNLDLYENSSSSVKDIGEIKYNTSTDQNDKAIVNQNNSMFSTFINIPQQNSTISMKTSTLSPSLNSIVKTTYMSPNYIYAEQSSISDKTTTTHNTLDQTKIQSETEALFQPSIDISNTFVKNIDESTIKSDVLFNTERSEKETSSHLFTTAQLNKYDATKQSATVRTDDILTSSFVETKDQKPLLYPSAVTAFNTQSIASENYTTFAPYNDTTIKKPITDIISLLENVASNSYSSTNTKENNFITHTQSITTSSTTQANIEETTPSAMTGESMTLRTDTQSSTTKENSMSETIKLEPQIDRPLAPPTHTDLPQSDTKIEKINAILTANSLTPESNLRKSSIYDSITEPTQANIKLNNESRTKTTNGHTSDDHNTLGGINLQTQSIDLISITNPNIMNQYVTKSIEKKVLSESGTTETVQNYYHNTNYASSVANETLSVTLPEVKTTSTAETKPILNNITSPVDLGTLHEKIGTTDSDANASTLTTPSAQSVNINNQSTFTKLSLNQAKQPGNSINSEQVSQAPNAVLAEAEVRPIYASLDTILQVPVRKAINTEYDANIDPSTRPVRRDLVNADYSKLNIKADKHSYPTVTFNTVQSTTTSNQGANTNIEYIKNKSDTVTRPQAAKNIPNESTSYLSSSYYEVLTEVITTSDVLVDRKIDSEKSHSGIISFIKQAPKSHESKEKKEKSETKETEAEEQQEKPINVELASLQDTGVLTATTDIPVVPHKKAQTREEILIKQESNNFKTTTNGSQTEQRSTTKNSTNKHNDTNTAAIGYQKETPTHELIENSAPSTTDSHFSNNKSQDQNTNIPLAHNNPDISKDQSSTPRYMTQTKSTAATSTQTTGLPTSESTTKAALNKLFCKQRKRGRYADELDCRKFYVCLGNKSTHIIEGTCPVNTVFSEINKQCTKNLSHCIRNNQFRCVTEGRFGDYLNDNVYYICARNNLSHFIRFKLQCQNGYHLNKTSVRCVLNNEPTSLSESRSASEQSSSLTKQEIKEMPGKSEKNSLSESKSASEQSSASIKQEVKESPEKSEKKFKCKKEGVFPDPSNCKKYFECRKVDSESSYRQKRKKCDSGEIFHKDKKKCVDADSYEC